MEINQEIARLKFELQRKEMVSTALEEQRNTALNVVANLKADNDLKSGFIEKLQENIARLTKEAKNPSEG